MFQGFKQFMLRGNVLDLAVAVVMGAAFGAVVTALVKDLITPLIAAIISRKETTALMKSPIKNLLPLTVNSIAEKSGFPILAQLFISLLFCQSTSFSRACGGARRRRTRPPRNARNVSAMYRSQHAAARSARPRSPNPT